MESEKISKIDRAMSIMGGQGVNLSVLEFNYFLDIIVNQLTCHDRFEIAKSFFKKFFF